MMKLKLTPKTALLVAAFDIVFSIGVGLIVAIFFGGIESSGNRVIDGFIDNSLYVTIASAAIMLFISFYVFSDSNRDIFYERKRFALSKFYYLYPLAWIAISVGALVQVEFAAYTTSDILRLAVLTIAVGINEEIAARGILLVGMRNGGLAEWKAWLVTLVIFSLSHFGNLLGGGSIAVLFIVMTGGTLLYVARRVFNNLWVPMGMHALYDFGFYLLTGLYAVDASLPDSVLDYQLGSFLFLLVVSILFLVFGRRLFKAETVGWS